MGKRNKKRPSSNLLVGQEYYVITFAQICSSHRWSSRYIAADDSFRDAIWFCCRFSVRYLTSEIAWVEMGMQCTSSNDYQQENDKKKWAVRWYPFLFRLASERISLPDGVKYPYTGCRLQYLLEDGGTVVFIFATITFSVGYGCRCRRYLVRLQLSTVWLPTKPYLRSKRGLVGMLLSINWFYE